MAGSWSGITISAGSREGANTGVRCFEATFTADATDGSIPDFVIVGSHAREASDNNEGGLVQRFTVEHGATAPSGLVVKLLDEDGTVIGNEDGDVSTGSFNFPVNQFHVGRLTITCSGNTVNSATGTVRVYVR